MDRFSDKPKSLGTCFGRRFLFSSGNYTFLGLDHFSGSMFQTGPRVQVQPRVTLPAAGAPVAHVPRGNRSPGKTGGGGRRGFFHLLKNILYFILVVLKGIDFTTGNMFSFLLGGEKANGRFTLCIARIPSHFLGRFGGKNIYIYIYTAHLGQSTEEVRSWLYSGLLVWRSWKPSRRLSCSMAKPKLLFFLVWRFQPFGWS